MRQAFSGQQQFDCPGVSGVQLNLECRDEMIPILAALQRLQPAGKSRCDSQSGGVDVNPDSRDDVGREGMDYWQLLVLESVRLGCNLDYDKLQDLAEQHWNLRHMLGIGDWSEEVDFSWRRIRDNVCLLKPAVNPDCFHAIAIGRVMRPPFHAQPIRPHPRLVDERPSNARSADRPPHRYLRQGLNSLD